MAFTEAFHHPSPTGARLQVYATLPEGARPRAIVQINHGLAEHAGRYARFAGLLAARGFASYAHDHRGHGRTQAPDAPLGRFAASEGAAKVVADVLAVHDLIAERHPGLPVIVFGHSMGGLVALDFALARPTRAAALAVWNANLSAGILGRLAQGILAWERFRMGSDVPSRLLPRLTFAAWGNAMPNPRTSFDWLSRDEAEVDAYVADPLCGWDASVSLWQDVFRLVFLSASDRNLASLPKHLPIHLVGGAEDPATDKGKAVSALSSRLAALGFSDVTTRIYPNTRHESLNELNRDGIMHDFAEWLEALPKG